MNSNLLFKKNMQKNLIGFIFAIAILGLCILLPMIMSLLYPEENSMIYKISMIVLLLSQIALLCNIVLSAFINSMFSNLEETEAPIRFSFFEKEYIFRYKVRFLLFGLLVLVLFSLACLFFPKDISISIAVVFLLGELLYWMCLYLQTLYKLRLLNIQTQTIKNQPPVREQAQQINIHLAKEDDTPEEPVETPQAKEDYTLVALRSLLHSNSVSVRKNAIKSLGKSQKMDVLPLLLECLGDEAHEVRAQLASTLWKMKAENMQEPLKCLAHDDFVDVRVAAIEALGHVSQNDTENTIIQALEDEYPEVRGAAAEAIGNLALFEGLEPLLAQINDSDWFVRHKIVIALGRIPGLPSRNMLEKLMQATHDVHEDVARTSKHVLMRMAEEYSYDDDCSKILNDFFEKEQKKENDSVTSENSEENESTTSNNESQQTENSEENE